MKTNPYDTARKQALYNAGYRLHGRTWRLAIEGCLPYGLTPSEQEINRRGGRNCGTNTDALFKELCEELKAEIYMHYSDVELDNDVDSDDEDYNYINSIRKKRELYRELVLI